MSDFRLRIPDPPEYLAERAARAPTREEFLEILDRAGTADPEPEDALEE